jgi:CubicO group peptidase (beta-lactamase class C family)
MHAHRLRAGLAAVSLAALPCTPPVPAVHPAAHPATAAGAAATSPAGVDAAAIDAHIRGALARLAVPGLAVVVTRNGRTVHLAGYGHDSGGRAVTADTRMRAASLSKSMTAVAVLRLVDSGALDLDAPVRRYLPELRLDDPRIEQVTVRHLLTQTSGLVETEVPLGEAVRSGTLEGYVGALSRGRMVGAPGRTFRYGNVNYEIAARLVEVVTGRPFAAVMTGEVFAPLGMGRTTVGPAGDPPADGHITAYPFSIPVHDSDFAGGAGGVVTTARDLGRWLRFHQGYGPRLLTEETFRQMHSPGPDGRYAMGWHVAGDGSGALEHPGNVGTFTAEEMLLPSAGIGAALLLNASMRPDDSTVVAEGIKAMALGLPLPRPTHDARTLALACWAAAVAVLGLGAVLLAGARRWAARHGDSSRWRRAAGLVPYALGVMPLALYPALVRSASSPRRVTLSEIVDYTPLVVAVLCLTAAVGPAVAVRRLRFLRGGRAARP